jgi:urease accessory protein
MRRGIIISALKTFDKVQNWPGDQQTDQQTNHPMDRPTAAQLAALLQLASPALPIGAFSYSQGLEAAVNAKVVVDEASAGAWIKSQFEQSFLPRELFSLHAAFLEIERLISLTVDAPDVGLRKLEDVKDMVPKELALENLALSELSHIDQGFVASRDSAEGRLEARQLGASLCRWLKSVAPDHPIGRLLAQLRGLQDGNIASSSAFAGVGLSQGLSVEMTCFAWAFSWLENQVQAAVKLVPLGQSSGQRLLMSLRPLSGMAPPPQPWTCTPMASLLMMRHERQYSRLFRS